MNWLEGWVHFVPLSTEIDDLPAVMPYLSSTGELDGKLTAETGPM